VADILAGGDLAGKLVAGEWREGRESDIGDTKMAGTIATNQYLILQSDHKKSKPNTP